MLIKYIILSLLLSLSGTTAGEAGSPIPSLEEVLEDAYGGISAFTISLEEKEEMQASGNAPTYGELTPQGILVVTQYMKEKLNDFFGDKLPTKLAFMDVGSGAGKVPLGVCLKGPFHRCVGVEYSQERHSIAVQAYQKIALEGATLIPEGREVTFINADALKTDMSGMHALYVSSYCFKKPFMEKLLGKFEKELPDGAVVITSQELPITAQNRLKLIRIFTLSQSWKSDSKAYAYQVGLKGVIEVKNDIPPGWRPNYRVL